MSASISPTRCPPPRRASATARFAETVDLPTPPLPDEIARMVPRWGSSTGVGGGDAARTGAGSGLAGSGARRSTARVGDVDPHRRDPVHTLHRLPHLARERAGIIASEQER